MATKQPNKNTLKKFLRLWKAGEISKEEAERQIGVTTAHGKYITRQWARRLGVDTRFGRSNVMTASEGAIKDIVGS